MSRNFTERRTVLVVNDDQRVLDVLVELLEREGYKVVSASDGIGAVDLAQSSEPNIIISDVVMPVVSGIELCRRLKRDARTANVPVLLMSGIRVSDEDSFEGLSAGADDYLDVPFRDEELLVKVARLTERHQVEKHYRDMVEQAADIIYTRNMEGYITSINAAGGRFFGRPVTSLVGSPLIELMGANAAKNIAEARTQTEPVRSVHCLSDAQGTQRYLEEVTTAERNRSGQPTRVRGVVRDITEQKLADKALKESEERYRQLVELSPEAIIVQSEGKFVYLNRAALELWGASEPGELIGRDILDFVHPDYRDPVMKRVRSIQTDGVQTPLVEEKFIKLNGDVIEVEVTGMPFTFQGKPAVQAVIRDITARRLAEEALAQQAEREAMSHRISQAVRRSLDSAEIFQTAVCELGTHLNVDRCSLFMRDEHARRATNVAQYHVPGVEPAGRDFDLAPLQGLIDELSLKGVLAVDDAACDKRIAGLYDQMLGKANVRSIMYVAIRVGDDMPAAFALSTTRSVRQWTEADIALATAVADQTGIAIRQAELYQKAETTSTREALVNRLSLAIRASLSLLEVLSTATRELGLALSASRVHLRLYNREHSVSPVEHEYVAPDCSSISRLDVSYEDPIGQQLLNSSRPIVIDDALNYSEGPPEFSACIRNHAQAAKLRSQIDYPLIVKGLFRGVLCIHQTDRVRHWTEDEVALVESVAAQLVTGIAQAELFEMVARGKTEWETTFDAMSDGIFIFDSVGRLKRVNRAGAGMENTLPQSLLGRRCCDILRSSAEEECVVERAISEARSVTIEITSERFSRPLLVSVEPVLDAEKRTVAIVCTARDLSELRKVEAVAREHQSLLTNILESARESIYAVDTEGRFQWFNGATIAGLGIRREDLIGRNLLDVIYEVDRGIVSEKLADALKGQPQTYEMRYFAHDGRLRYARVDNSPLVVEGRTTGVLGIARDITEQKEERGRAARADKLRALGQLASGVAHDFNNSLAAILGRAQLLRRQTKDEALLRNVNIIQTAAEDAAATVRRIQTFARKSPVKEFEMLDIRRLLTDAVEITRTRWENEARLRGLDYEVKLDAENGLYASGNASELREVFVNLIVNAVDAMPAGGRISVSCVRNCDRLTLTFADSGTGMASDVLEKIFEPFFSTKGAQGTGLGLSVSYSLIERHEGSISVVSEVGQGTIFTIDLPAASPQSSPTNETLNLNETLSLSILVVDDEPFVRETLADMLVALNHRVAVADGGRQALQQLAVGDFDLVFTDLAMPEMDGWETAREVRRRWPNMSVVLVTGYGTGTLPPRGEAGLIDGIIGKPFDFTQVSEAVARIAAKAELAGVDR